MVDINQQQCIAAWEQLAAHNGEPHVGVSAALEDLQGEEVDAEDLVVDAVGRDASDDASACCDDVGGTRVVLCVYTTDQGWVRPQDVNVHVCDAYCSCKRPLQWQDVDDL